MSVVLSTCSTVMGASVGGAQRAGDILDVGGRVKGQREGSVGLAPYYILVHI